MKKLLLIALCIFCCYHCKPKHSTVITKKAVIERKKNNTPQPIPSRQKILSKPSKIVNYSKQFLGTRYKWGGTTKAGMDCSGLVYESFRAHDVYLPRISRDMAKKGHSIALKKVLKGDLLFFKTNKNKRNAINHVGLIVDIKNNDIYFIHATSSKGVIISSINQSYWKSAFAEARRVL
jgi:cell wall-associated NlpC family hydrolase